MNFFLPLFFKVKERKFFLFKFASMFIQHFQESLVLSFFIIIIVITNYPVAYMCAAGSSGDGGLPERDGGE